MDKIRVELRDNTLVPLDPNKYHEHVNKAVKGFDVSASEIEYDAEIMFVDGIKADDIQLGLITSASEKIYDDPEYQIPAGRLLNQHLRNIVYGQFEPLPFIDMIDKNVKLGVYDGEYLFKHYTREELIEFGNHIDYEKDEFTTYTALKVDFDSYITKQHGKHVETPQEINMLINLFAFALYKDKYSKEYRKHWVITGYNILKDGRASLPTPIMKQLRTVYRKFLSCVKIPMGDTKETIANASSTVYILVADGSGIGLGAYDMRGLNADIGDGRMKHTGTFQVLKAFEKTTKAFTQPDRHGSTTTYYPFFHMEIEQYCILGNAKGTTDTRIRDMDHAIMFNDFFFERYANGEEITLFFMNDVPDIMSYIGDYDKFKKRYEYAEKTVPLERQVKIPAHTIFTLFNDESILQARLYSTFMDNIKNQGPFKIPIKQSNLCVAGDTKILTKAYGYRKIGNIVESGIKQTECWNGEEWSMTPLFKTSDNEKVLKVYLSNGMYLEVTDYHKWYIKEDGVIKERRTSELNQNDILTDFDLPEKTDKTIDIYMLKLFMSRWGMFYEKNNKLNILVRSNIDGMYLFTLNLQELGIHVSVEVDIKDTDYLLARIDSVGLNKLKVEGIELPNMGYIFEDEPLRDMSDITVLKIVDENKTMPVYCGTEPKRNKLMFNGVLTGNCTEIFTPVYPIIDMVNIKRNISFKSDFDKEEFYRLRQEAYFYSTKDEDILYYKKEMSKYFTFTNPNLLADVDEKTHYDYFTLEGYVNLSEVGVCIIAGINLGMCKNDNELKEVSEYLIRLEDELIDYMDYSLPTVEKAAKMRRTVGVGFSDVFHLLAINKVKYNSREGRQLLNDKTELCAYTMLQTNIQLAKDFGPCMLYRDTKYSDGITLKDTYNRNTDELIDIPYKQDWDSLKPLLLKYGIRLSTMLANAPFGTSSFRSGSQAGIEPPRALIAKKDSMPKVVPDYGLYDEYWTTAWSSEFNNLDYIKSMSLIMKWLDQGMSLNRYQNLLKYVDKKIPMSELISEMLSCRYYGHKSTYYNNIHSKTNNVNDKLIENIKIEDVETDITDEEIRDGVEFIVNDSKQTLDIYEEEDDISCGSGGCSI